MSVRRIAALARLELALHLREPLFWALVAGVLLFSIAVHPTALLPAGAAAVEGVSPFSNSRYALAQLFALAGFLVYTLFAALLAGLAALRDDERGISELVRATPLSAEEWVTGKLGGALSALLGALALQTAFVIAWFELGLAEGGAASLGPFRLASYLVPALLFAAPGIVCTSALAFAIGERTRRPLAVYAFAAALFVSTLFVLWSWAPPWMPPGVDRLLAVVDPSTLRWLGRSLLRLDRGADFYNRAPLALDGSFLANRLWTAGITLLAALATVRHARKWRRGAAPTRAALARQAVRPLSTRAASPPRLWAALGMASAPPGLLRSVATVARVELGALVTQPAALLFALFVPLQSVQHAVFATDAGGAPARSTAGTLAVDAFLPFSVLVALFLLFVTVEAGERGRANGFAVLELATPVTTEAIHLGRIVVAGTIVAALAAVTVAGCATALALEPGARFELAPFGVVFGLLLLPTCLVWTAFVLFAHALLGSRLATYVAGLAALAATAVELQRGALTWVTNWPLWGALVWSDLGAFEPDRRALALNRLEMLLAAGALCAAASATFARRERDPARVAGALGSAAARRRAGRLALAALPALATGLWLGAEIRAGFQGGPAERRGREYRLRNVATWADIEPPRRERIDVAIELDPARRRTKVDGRFLLRNDGDRPIGILPFTVGESFDRVRWTVAGSPVSAEARAGLEVLRLAEPLAPGERVEVGFSYAATYPRGPTRNGGRLRHFVLPSGVLLSTLRGEFLPRPGFDAERGLDRRARPAPRDLPSVLAAGGPGERRPDRFAVRLAVTTPSEYRAISLGTRISESTRDGKATTVFESAAPVTDFAIVAGRWRRRDADGVEVHFDPRHEENVEEILTTMVAARATYSRWFGELPWRELRAGEYPALDRDATSFPAVLAISEGLGFVARSGASTLPFEVVAHEMAHQWWPHAIPVREAPGAGVLIEGMANFATLLLYEAERSDAARRSLALRLEERYLEARRVDSERPLTQIVESRPGDEETVAAKGAWALSMLRDRLGDAATLGALAAFAERARADAIGGTLEDFLEEALERSVDRAVDRHLVEQWFAGRVLPELRLEEVRVRPAGGEWLVSARLENVGSGMVDVAVAAVGSAPSGAGAEPLTALRTARAVAPGAPRRLEWRIPFRPERLVVDPEVRLLQLHRARALARVPSADGG